MQRPQEEFAKEQSPGNEFHPLNEKRLRRYTTDHEWAVYLNSLWFHKKEKIIRLVLSIEEWDELPESEDEDIAEHFSDILEPYKGFAVQDILYFQGDDEEAVQAYVDKEEDEEVQGDLLFLVVDFKANAKSVMKQKRKVNENSAK